MGRLFKPWMAAKRRHPFVGILGHCRSPLLIDRSLL